MRKLSILDLIFGWVVTQTITAGLYRYEKIDSLILVYSPSIIFFGVGILAIFITWFSYKYFNNGKSKWTNKK